MRKDNISVMKMDAQTILVADAAKRVFACKHINIRILIDIWKGTLRIVGLSVTIICCIDFMQIVLGQEFQVLAIPKSSDLGVKT